MFVFGSLKIGVLGGIGPEATTEFYKKLIFELQKKKLVKSNLDFPQIIINSIPAPELIKSEVSSSELRPYINGLKELDALKPDFIVMVCNTIHLFYETLQNQITAPILDLRKAVRNEIVSNGLEPICVLATPFALNRNLYKFNDLKYAELNSEQIFKLKKIIFNYNCGYQKEKQATELKKLCEKQLRLGAKTILLGCTELAVILENAGFPKVNSIDVLVDATIKRILECK